MNKLVNGVLVKLSAAEERALLAEWAAHAEQQAAKEATNSSQSAA